MKSVVAHINLQALKHNLRQVKKIAPDKEIVSVIKSNAYGHGVLPVARALEYSDYFAVARLSEAIYLRKQAIDKPIILLEGVYSLDEYRECFNLKLIPVIHSLQQFYSLKKFIAEQLTLLSFRNKDDIFQYWFKLDTGMHRLGLSADDVDCLLVKETDFFNFSSSSRHRLSAVISHFCCADEINNTYNQQQIEQYNQYYRKFINVFGYDPKILRKSMANSAAILSLPQAYFDLLRPGIMLYGVSPFAMAGEEENALHQQLLAVMTLSAPVIAIKHLNKGDCLGYGASWCCPEDMTIAIIAIGYGDGYPRHAQPGTPVLIKGVKLPLVGRVSMDMICVDLSNLKNTSIIINVGDSAILWGDGLPIEQIAQHASTIAYELLCQITSRVKFDYAFD